MAEQPDGIDWSLTTWEGSRREQLRRWSELSFDEILEALAEMCDPPGPRSNRDAGKACPTSIPLSRRNRWSLANHRR